MKIIKKVGICFLTLLMAFGLNSAILYAQENIQDGLNVTLETDKDSYGETDAVKAEVKVENQNDVVMKNIHIETVVPEGFTLADTSKASLDIAALNGKDSVSLSSEFKADVKQNGGMITPEDNNPSNTDNGNSTITDTNNKNENTTKVDTPKNDVDTGDHTNITFLFSLLVASGCMMAVYAVKHKKVKKATTFLLCLLMAATLLPASDIKANEQDTKGLITVEKTVKVNGKDVTIKSQVTYDKNNGEVEVTYTRGEWIQKLVDAVGYPDNASQRDEVFNDIANSEYKDAIETAFTYGLIEKSETFQPEQPATREFAAITAVRALGYLSGEEINCKDASEITYKKEVFLAVDTGLMNLEQNNFYPKRALNEKEAKQIITKMIEIFGSTDAQGDTPEGYDFKDGVTTLDDSIEYKDENGVLTIKKTDDVKDLKEGAIIVIGYENAYKVESIKENGNNLEITYEKPELSEFLDSMNVGGQAPLDFSRFQPAEGVQVNYNSAANGIQTYGAMDDFFDVPENNVGINGSVQLSGEIDLGDNWSIDYSLETSMPTVGYKFDVDFDNFKPNVKNAYIKVQESTDLNVGFGKGTEITGPDSFICENKIEKRIKLGEVPVVGVYGVGIIVEVNLVMSAEGKFEVEYNSSGTFGVQVLNNKPRNISAIQNSISAGLSGSVTVGPQIELGAQLFGCNLISFSAEAGGKASGYIKARSTGLVCADVTLCLYAELNAFEYSVLDDWLDIGMTFTIWDENNSPLKISKHYENMQAVPECTYENGGTIEGSVADADVHTQYIKNANIEIINSENMKTAATVKTDANGKYTATVPGGTYIVKISKDGYIPFESLETVMDKNKIYLETYLMVNGDEQEIGTIGGHVTNSVTGSAIPNTKLTIRKGWNHTTGDVVKTVMTDPFGGYKVDLPLGNYTVLMENSGYVTNHINIAVTKGIHMDKHGALVPDENSEIPTGDLRIVLTWGKEPSDLDSHLIGPKAAGDGNFHIYFHNKAYKNNGVINSFLDLDDVDGSGPETTTIYKMNQNGKYSFYVHNYSNSYEHNSSAMASSGAQVKVYAGQTLIATYNVPNRSGTLWHVFDFDAKTKKLIPINTMSYQENAYDVGTDSSISTFSLEDKTELKDYEKADIQKEETNSDSEPVEPVKETETPVNDAPVQEDKTIVENQEEIKTNASDDLENSEVIDKPLDGAVASEVNE